MITLTTIRAWFEQSLLANAAYAHFDARPQGANWEIDPAFVRGRLSTMAAESAEYLVRHFAVLAQRDETPLNAYSGTLFARRSSPVGRFSSLPDPARESGEYSEYIFAQRGTSGVADVLFDDSAIALLGKAAIQAVDMKAFWNRLVDPNRTNNPLADLPEIRAALQTQGVSLTGHSLGGNLAFHFADEYRSLVNAAYTFNSPGVLLQGQPVWGFPSPASQIAAQVFGLDPEGLHGKFNNVYGNSGPELITGVHSIVGDSFPIYIEETPGFLGVGLHSIRNLSNSLSIYYLLASMDTSLASEGGVATISAMLSALSPNSIDTREDFASYLKLVFADLRVGADDDGQTAIIDAINRLETNSLPPATITMLTGFSAEALSYRAMRPDETGASVRYSLVQGLPIAIASGTTFSDRPELALANFSPRYLQDRASFVEHLFAANNANRTIQTVGGPVLISGRADPYYAAEVDGSSVLRHLASNEQVAGSITSGADLTVTRHLFGVDDATPDDTITGAQGADLLYGGQGADVLDGAAGDDYLDGGAGNDLLRGGAGRNMVDGGTGNDGYEIALDSTITTIVNAEAFNATSNRDSILLRVAGGALVELGANIVAVPGAPGTSLDDLDNLYRRSGRSLTITTADGRTIVVENFDDGDLGLTLPSDAAAAPAAAPTGARVAILPDVGNTNPHSDPISPPGPWGVIGEESVGVYTTETNYSEVIDASALSPSRAYWELRGGFGDSYLTGVNSTANLMFDDYYMDGVGGWTQIGDDVGDDQIVGGASVNFIETHGGNDRVFGGAVSDIIVDRPEAPGQFGTVDWVNGAGHSNADDLYGGGGNDYLLANAGNAHLDGGDGADLLFGGAGSDLMLGGSGNDVLSGDTRQSGTVFAGVLTGIEFSPGNLGNDTTNFGADTLVGDAGNDHLIGGGGNDVLYGGTENDRLDGDFVGAPSGTWVYDSGVATQNFSVASLFAQHAVDPSSIHGVDTLHGEAGNDELIGGGNGDFLYGGGDSDILYGDAPSTLAAIPVADQGSDELYGDEGDDFLYGNGGDDYLDGGIGNDQMAGDLPGDSTQIGNDEMHGGDGADIMRGQGGADRMYGDAGNDQMGGDDGDDVIVGGDGDDLLNGNDGRDRLEGGLGFDTIDGNAGDDELHSSAGGDALFGGAGNDTFVIKAGSGETQVSDDEGITVVRFEAGISAGAVQVYPGTNIADGSQLIFVGYGGGDRLVIPSSTFATIDRFEFADGSRLTRFDLTRSFVPPTTGLGDRAVHTSVSASELTFVGVNDDLLIQYAGSVSNWIDTNDLASKRVFYSLRPASEYNLGAGQVLVLHNWYLSGAGQYLNSIADPGFPSGGAIDLYAAAYSIGRLFMNPGSSNVAMGSASNDTFVGSARPDVFAGADGNDTFDLGGGNDFAAGQSGNDIYRIAPGSGADALQEAGGADSIEFSGGLRSTDVVFHDTDSGLEAIIGNETDGNRIVVSTWFDGSAGQIESWVFSGDAVTLNAADVDARIVGNRRPTLAAALQDQSAASGQPFTFTVPAGSFVDPNQGDTLSYLASSIDGLPLPSWIIFNATTRTFSGTPPSGSSGTLDITVHAADQGGLNAFDTFRLNYAPPIITGTAASETINGGALGEIIDGLAGNDTLRGNGGNDTIIGGPGLDYLYGGAGDDVFVVRRGDEGAYVNPSDAVTGNADSLRFGPGISPSDLVYRTDSQGTLEIQIRDNGGAIGSDWVKLAEFLSPTYLDRRVTRVTFDEDPGATLTAAQLDALAMIPTSGDDYLRGGPGDELIDGLAGTDRIFGEGGNDLLIGGDGTDFLNGGAGNDELRGGAGGNSLSGGIGNDTFVVGRYEIGAITSIPHSGTGAADIDTLLFETGVLPGQVRVTHDGIRIRFSVPDVSGQLTALAVELTPSATPGSEADVLDFVRFQSDPSTVWTSDDIKHLSVTGNEQNEQGMYGYATADDMFGAGGDDKLYGVGGDDTLRGGTGNDYLDGGAGNDSYRFGPGDGNDVVIDASGANRIVLEAGLLPANVKLYRTSGRNLNYDSTSTDALVLVLNDGPDQLRIENYFTSASPTTFSQLVFGDGTTWNTASILANVINLAGTQNTLPGTAGNDTHSVDHRSDVVSEATAGGVDTVMSNVGHVLQNNVENLTLTGPFNLQGRGNSLDNVIRGNDMMNILLGAAGADTLYGNGGDDQLNGEAGADILIGGAGNDTYTIVGSGSGGLQDTATEGPAGGYDTIIAYAYDATLPAEVERLQLQEPIGGTYSSWAPRRILGNAGNNYIDARYAEAKGTGAQILIDGGAGADTMIGSIAPTRYVVDNPGDIVVERRSIEPYVSSSDIDLVQSSISFVLPDFVENLELTGGAAISGTGNSLDNLLDGSLNSAANFLVGGIGNDRYVLGAGDTASESANEGADTAIFATPAAGANVFDLAALPNFESLAVTDGALAATLLGDASGNALTGNASSNTLRGNGGDDTLNPGPYGTDVLEGGQGNDTYVFDLNRISVAGVSIVELTNAGIDLVESTETYTLGNNVENLTLTSTWAANGTGNTLDNVLTGNSGNNTLTGLAGNDTLNPGSAGTDSLVGGLGDDTYIVGRTSGITITESAGQGIDLVQASVTYTLGSNLENLTLTGGSATNGTGNTAANVLIGNGGVNTLSGLAGDDRLRGGAGNDTLRGGDGADRYEYAMGDGADTIDNNSADAAIDRLAFTDLARTQLSFSRAGNDLLMQRTGVSTDSVRVTNWFAVAGNQIDFVETAGGTVTSAAEINALVAGGGTTFPNGGSPQEATARDLSGLSAAARAASRGRYRLPGKERPWAAAEVEPVMSPWAMSHALLRNHLDVAAAGELGGDFMPDTPIMGGVVTDQSLRIPGGSQLALGRRLGVGMPSHGIDREVASL